MDRILIAEHEPEVRDNLVQWLRAAGLEPTICADGEEILRVVSRSSPDLILLDMHLPGAAGIDLCQALKGEDETNRVPIVILNPDASSEERTRFLEAGAEEFLHMPVGRQELLARVRSLLRAKHLSDRLLMSYYEMDKLGTFAEEFASQIMADLRVVDVASSMARQILGSDPELPSHPRLIWGGYESHGMMYGLVCYYEGEQWRQEMMEFPPEELIQALTPYERGVRQYISRRAPSAELRLLLHLPVSLQLGNFIAHIAGRHAALAAGYPWEVGLYEIPLLKAMIRHWSVLERIRHETRQTEKAFSYTMDALAIAAEFYDASTASHIRRVSGYAGTIARALGCDRRFVRWVSKCAKMHDVGKITIPLDIIRKPGRLDEKEIAVMRRHTVQGAFVLGESPHLAMARNIALSHHENHDGSGYPAGMRGDTIPIEARIVRAVDVYDALRNARSYKPAYTHQQAIAILRRGDERIVPAHFDPAVLEALLDTQDAIREIYDSAVQPLDCCQPKLVR